MAVDGRGEPAGGMWRRRASGRRLWRKEGRRGKGGVVFLACESGSGLVMWAFGSLSVCLPPRTLASQNEHDEMKRSASNIDGPPRGPCWPCVQRPPLVRDQAATPDCRRTALMVPCYLTDDNGAPLQST